MALKFTIMRNILFLIILVLASCGQRIELDEAQWEKDGKLHADITSGTYFFKWQVDDVKLNEDTKGVKRISVTDKSDVDTDNLTNTVTLKAGTDLTQIACYIYHNGVKVEPQDDTPAAGVISDFSKKTFTYRIYSVNGKYKDWTINLVTQ